MLEVILINLVLSGDNAIVIALAAAGLPTQQRNRAIAVGIVAATVLRIVFACLTVSMLKIVGLLLAGGLLLLWVCWKMWSELREGTDEDALEAAANPTAGTHPHHHKTLRQAVTQIVIADVSMSLDNVLAVAGAARDHLWVMVFGLALSIALMGLAASVIARLLTRHRWIGYVGLAVIVYVAVKMVYDGVLEVLPLI